MDCNKHKQQQLQEKKTVSSELLCCNLAPVVGIWQQPVSWPANVSRLFCCLRWRADPSTEASVKTHRRAAALTRERSGEKVRSRRDSPEAHAMNKQQKSLDKTDIGHIRAEASFTASQSSSEPSSPSPRILQPDSHYVTTTSWRQSHTLRGGGAGTYHAERSCKHTLVYCQNNVIILNWVRMKRWACLFFCVIKSLLMKQTLEQLQ